MRDRLPHYTSRSSWATVLEARLRLETAPRELEDPPAGARQSVKGILDRLYRIGLWIKGIAYDGNVGGLPPGGEGGRMRKMLPIDLLIPGVGRLHRSSGVQTTREQRALFAMLRLLPKLGYRELAS